MDKKTAERIAYKLIEESLNLERIEDDIRHARERLKRLAGKLDEKWYKPNVVKRS